MGVGLDGRIGKAFLQAGPGFGGSCFPKDSAALLATAQDHAVNLRLVESTIAANEARKRAMGRRIAAAVGGNLAGRTVAVLGLTFKPDTDDIRDAPPMALIGALQRAGATVRVYDPQGMEGARRQLGNVVFADGAYHCAEGADCVVLATHWAEFGALDARRLARAVRGRVLVDLRNGLDAAKFTAAGFVVHGIGRAKRLPDAKPTTVVLRNRTPRAVLTGAKRALNGSGRPLPPPLQDAPR